MKKLLTGVCLCSVLYFISCRMDNGTISNEIDDRLEELIKDHSENGKISFYVMPQSNEYSSIPNQDPNNPITAEKAALGKMLFFETGLAQEAKKSVSFNTYSCSSCHIPEKNFTAGRVQGIADGAIGFGRLGELRHKNPLYDGSEVDAQGARPLPTINLAYVRNALWSGAFGARGMNEGTQSAWGIADSLTSINHLGMEGLESNNTRALFVHRQVITKELMEKLGLKSMFDKAFPNVPDDQRYTRQIASNAIASYFRTIFTNEAPFQKWLKGDRSALSPQQKRGAELFLEKQGVSIAIIALHSMRSDLQPLASKTFIRIQMKFSEQVHSMQEIKVAAALPCEMPICTNLKFRNYIISKVWDSIFMAQASIHFVK